MLTAAPGRAVSPRIPDVMSKASDLWIRGEKCLAQLYLSQAALPPLIGEPQAFALFAAEALLEAGLSPRALMQELGFDPVVLEGLEKYSPDQPRVPAGNGRASGQWTSGGAGTSGAGARGDGISVETKGRQYALADEPPPQRRIHPDTTYESDPAAKRSLEYWRTQPTEEIVPTLKPGLEEALKVKPDGAIANGYTRVKTLQERGFDVNSLPRESYGRAFSSGGRLDVETPVGGGGPVHIFPTEE